MHTKEVLSRSNELLPATSHIQAVGGVVDKFRQEIELLVSELDRKGMNAAQFGSFLSSLHGLVNGLGCEVVERVLEEHDTPTASIQVDGARLRFRGSSDKAWLTAFGRVIVRRRCYCADGPDAAKAIPLDDACGMTGRLMTPDLEEMSAMCAAMLTQQETEQLLAKILPEGPSATAIRNVTTRLGEELEARSDDLEQAIEHLAPLSTDGDVLVASWDGVMVPMRKSTDGEPAGWKEAGVATVSVYKKGQTSPSARMLATSRGCQSLEWRPSWIVSLLRWRKRRLRIRIERSWCFATVAMPSGVRPKLGRSSPELSWLWTFTTLHRT
jgi:hypothetical protein